jgi:hypothetical protein
MKVAVEGALPGAVQNRTTSVNGEQPIQELGNRKTDGFRCPTDVAAVGRTTVASIRWALLTEGDGPHSRRSRAGGSAQTSAWSLDDGLGDGASDSPSPIPRPVPSVRTVSRT